MGQVGDWQESRRRVSRWARYGRQTVRKPRSQAAIPYSDGTDVLARRSVLYASVPEVHTLYVTCQIYVSLQAYNGDVWKVETHTAR